MSGAGFFWKAVAILIVIFWLVMTGQLARVLMFPDQSSLAEVPPSYLLELFLRRNEPSQLVIMDGGAKLGEVSVGTKSAEMKRRDGLGGEPEPVTQVNLAGFIEVDHPAIATDEVSGRIRINLRNDFSLWSIGLFLRQPGVTEAVDFEFTLDPPDLVVRRIERGKVLDESRPLEDEATKMQMQMMLAMWGIDLAGATEVMAGTKASAGAATEAESGGAVALGRRLGFDEDSLRAYHGQVEVRGQRFHAYVLELYTEEQRALRMTFSEAGELMRVETMLDYELLSEVFVADESRRERLDSFQLGDEVEASEEDEAADQDGDEPGKKQGDDRN